MQEAQDDDSDLEESDNLDEDNGQDGTEPVGQVNEEMDLAELQE